MSHPERDARSRSALLIVLMLLSGLLPASAQQTSSDTGSPVGIRLTVVDKQSKKFINTLRQEDVRVLEDGVPQIITDFKQQTGKPLSIVIMLDMSMSQEKIIPVAKQVSREFVDSIITSGKDSVGVVSFTGAAKFEQELTNDLREVQQAIARLKFIPPSGYVSGIGFPLPSKATKDQQMQGTTAIWDAVSLASEKFGAEASANLHRVVILFTDGHDTSSKQTLNEAVKVALEAGVVVYSVGFGDEYYGGINKDVLRKISERTSGRAFFPKKITDVQAAFAEIEQELRTQYFISYSS